uniref:RNA recognition motif domain containing protein n=1 Tax=Haemonchus contortus TaxID=6289 RepID=U6PCH4_HAECO|nr:RNA recognition motif domain containing protein [Haemonchus contortus]
MDAKVLSHTLVTTSTPTKSYVPSQRYCTAPNVEIGESKTNLIINYLPQGMTQEEVRSLFSSVGEIESCKLVRDKMTGQSLGYGFVNYCRENDALKAVSSFNGLRLQNKTIKVSYARPSNENIKGSNLYVSGIPKSMTLNELEAIFRPFGQIITSRILSDNITGLSKGVGFVRFDKKEEAELAIQTLNGTIPPGCVDQITVKFANNPATNTAKSVLQELEAAQQVAASNLVPLSLLGAAAPLRSAIGPIHHAPLAAKYRYSPLAPAIPGAAAPALTAQATADYLTTMLQMSQMNALAGMAAATAPATAQLAALTPTAAATEPAGFCLFAYNLGPDTEDSLLWQLFGPFGAVLSVKVIRDFATTKCKGYAFVTMMNYADACNAIAALNGTQIAGRSLQVTFKAASATSSLI